MNISEAVLKANASSEEALTIQLNDDYRIIKGGYIVSLARKGDNGIYERVDAFPACGDVKAGLEKFSPADAKYIEDDRMNNLNGFISKWAEIVGGYMIKLNENEKRVLRDVWNASVDFNGGEGWGCVSDLGGLDGMSNHQYAGYLSALSDKGLYHSAMVSLSDESATFQLDEKVQDILGVTFLI